MEGKKMILRMIVGVMLLVAGLFSHAETVWDEDYQVQVVTADKMTCEQAVDQYEKYGRIYVIAHGKNIVPIYGMIPIRKKRDLHCRGRSSMKATYHVRTRDNSRCGIAVFCM